MGDQEEKYDQNTEKPEAMQGNADAASCQDLGNLMKDTDKCIGSLSKASKPTKLHKQGALLPAQQHPNGTAHCAK